MNSYDYFGKMYKTASGTKFHFIQTFKPKDRYYFTFKPSLIDLDFVYKDVMGGNIK